MSALLTPARREFLISALRYGVAGVFNTLVGFSIIVALDVGLHLPAHLANAIGYAVGVCVSFVLSKLFVFKARRTGRSTPVRYVVAVAVAFALNQGVLTLAKLVLPAGPLWSVAAQGAAAVSYTGALFLLSHFWVFAHAAPPSAHPRESGDPS
ncbi:GtrA family protein [uncultured Caulobacter sp.]|uniref:GtrA family protein n=1 Tax=uncultured Caulobacter sp. TaxID=158749 RepID=UPI0026093A24|nr:GtrA family protein [uncultured Caulobacter sp.]